MGLALSHFQGGTVKKTTLYISGEASEHDCWWHRDHTNASIGEDFVNLWCEHCIPLSMVYVNIATAANQCHLGQGRVQGS